jgi:uncharacterized protein (TIGR00369 family)
MPKKLLDIMHAYIKGEVPPPPVARLVGFRLTAVEPGKAVFEMEANENHANPMGTLHGGILCDIADAAMGVACASLLNEGETFTTLELKINFLKPIWKAKLKAIGTIIKQGYTVSMAECDITDERENLVAKATSTQMILRGEKAKGR